MGFFSHKTAMPPTSLAAVNIAAAAFKANPYPYYARLRAEAPVLHFDMLQGEPGWLVTRYDDVVTVLKDERFIKSRRAALTPEQAANQPWYHRWHVFGAFAHNMLSQDPPNHTRLRALVSKTFTPTLIETMRGRVEQLTNGLLDQVQRQGRMDIIRDYALPLPATIIAEMLGVPTADMHKFHRYSNALISVASMWQLMKAIPSIFAFLRYNRRIVAQRRADPRDDLVSALVRAEEAGQKLSAEEIEAMLGLLLVAGHETTVNLIGNGMLALFEHPEQMERLRREPALIKPAVEEMLRHSSPVDVSTERFAREDLTIAGVTIRRGEMVYAGLGSANRDERQFPNPDKLDITREPNRHLAFGLGTHFCLGAALARLEGQIAIATLLRRLPNLRLGVPVADLQWRSGLVGRGLQALPVAFDNG